MKKLLLVVALLLVVFWVYRLYFKKDNTQREKPQPIMVGEHSAGFNASMGNLMNAYYMLTEGFVNWDTSAVTASAGALSKAFNNLQIDELKSDTIIYQTILFPLENAKTAVTGILSSQDWAGKRHSLNDLSDNLRQLLQVVKYDDEIIYWQECPMAFGDNAPGNWLSNTKEIINPYLGKKDPKYGNSMLNCGEIKMTLDFSKKDSVQVK